MRRAHHGATLGGQRGLNSAAKRLTPPQFRVPAPRTRARQLVRALTPIILSPRMTDAPATVSAGIAAGATDDPSRRRRDLAPLVVFLLAFAAVFFRTPSPL